MTAPLNRLSFLDLPFAVRRKIYLFCGLLRSCPIDLNHRHPVRRAKYTKQCLEQPDSFSNDADSLRVILPSARCIDQARVEEERLPFGDPTGGDCICRPIPWSLFFVCRSLYKEVKALFFSENRFKVSRSDHGGLQPLRKLDHAALGKIVSLHIQLNSCGADTPLSSRSLDPLGIVQEWRELALHLATNIIPGRLKLGLIYDTTDPAIARQITAPLGDWPALSQCSIRLGEHPNFQLRQIAQEAVEQVTRQPSSSAMTFRWLNLPSEIQTLVLQHSELVYRKPFECYENRISGLSKSCCLKCTPILEACYCPSLHAASTSNTCTCWRWPVELFLVSKSFRQQALRVAYGFNEFHIHTPGGTYWGIPGRPNPWTDHTTIVKFLTAIPTDALPYLRSLRLIISHGEVDKLNPGTRSLAEWIHCLIFIRQHLDLPNMDLSITTDRLLKEEAFVGGPNGEILLGDSNDENREWAFYQRFTAPAVILKKCHRLTVFFPEAVYPEVKDEGRSMRNCWRERQLQRMLAGEDIAETEEGVTERAEEGSQEQKNDAQHMSC